MSKEKIVKELWPNRRAIMEKLEVSESTVYRLARKLNLTCEGGKRIDIELFLKLWPDLEAIEKQMGYKRERSANLASELRKKGYTVPYRYAEKSKFCIHNKNHVGKFTELYPNYDAICDYFNIPRNYAYIITQRLKMRSLI